ncbi:hypothetical protein [Lysobacter sp. TAB13]|uniref:hypothetical protein n=1 Tax=Lysobacter sp. TAB13 TaxID=3233065 RepID=UPI003F9AD1F9
MNRRPDAPDPLSPEERDLADRLLRLGPNDGPSSALDAKILAAAHAAVAQTPRARARKTRWPAWIGVAASLSLAVGIAWQLRPMDKAAEAMREDQVAVAASASASDSSAAADAAAAAPAPANQDSIAGQGGAAPAAAAEDAAASAQMAKNVAVPIPPAPAELSSPPSRIAPPPPPPPQFAKRSNAATDTDTGSLASANRAAEPRPEQVYERGYSKSQERNDAAYPAKVMAAPPPPPAPVPNFDPAPIAAPAPFPADAAPAAAPAPAAPSPLARDAAKPGSEAKMRRVAPAAVSGLSAAEAEAPAGAQPTQSRAKSETFKAAAEETKSMPPQPVREDSALDRVMVTGSRISGNVEDDSKLPAAQWLDRIREYRDGGELERARESLRQFRRSHPRSRVPRDLRPLLK